MPTSNSSSPDAWELRRRAPALRILVVEDSEVLAEVTRAYLTGGGHDVVVVPDGRAAISTALGGRFDLVLMDLNMPLMDGFAATEIILRLAGDQHIPIVACSSDDRPEVVKRCEEVGMIGFLPKPFSKRELLACLPLWVPRETPLAG